MRFVGVTNILPYFSWSQDQIRRENQLRHFSLQSSNSQLCQGLRIANPEELVRQGGLGLNFQL